MLTTEQRKQRGNYIGASQVPVIMGDSKFKKSWDLLLDIAGVEQIEKKDNMYTSLGNILEPIIRKLVGARNVDELEFESEQYYLPIVGHIDGIRMMANSQDQLEEYKCTGSSLEETYMQYRSQVQTYLNMTGMKTCNFRLLQRTGELKKVFNKVRDNNFEHGDYELEYVSKEHQVKVENELSQVISEIKIRKGDIQTLKVKYNKDYQNTIDNQLNIFFKYLEMLQNDPFLDLEELKLEFNKSMVEYQMKSKQKKMQRIKERKLQQRKKVY